MLQIETVPPAGSVYGNPIIFRETVMLNFVRSFGAVALLALPFSASADLTGVPSGKYTLESARGLQSLRHGTGTR